jgi:hypothetical protein
LSHAPPDSAPGAAAFAEVNDRRDASGGLDLRPIIRWTEGALPEIVDQAEAALLQSEVRLFQRGSLLVRVVRRESMSVRQHTRRPPGGLSIVMVDKPYLVEAMTRAARWERWDKRSEAWRVCNAPEQAAITYLSRVGHWKLPRLLAAISAPTLRPDGSVLQTPGYDEATGTWYDPCGIDYHNVPNSPTRSQAEEALNDLLWVLRTFPFEEDVDRAVALAMVLTSLVRRSLPAAPLGGISAPLRGSGKTLLADCIAIIATGVSAPAMQYPETDEEASKTALAVLAEGDAVVLIDNVERTLQGDWLCTILTSETFRARMLGRTEMLSVPTSTLFLATGNHLQISGDLSTRALVCRIDPHLEKPEERAFDDDLRIWISRNRPRLVVAGLTVMRACLLADKAELPKLKPFGRFEQWSDLVRLPLVWLGQEDPCGSLRVLEREDPLRAELLQMLQTWSDCFGNEPKTVRQIVEEVTSEMRQSDHSKALRDATEAISADRGGQINARRLSKWLSKNAGRICDGRQFQRCGERYNSVLWQAINIQ